MIFNMLVKQSLTLHRKVSKGGLFTVKQFPEINSEIGVMLVKTEFGPDITAFGIVPFAVKI